MLETSNRELAKVLWDYHQISNKLRNVDIIIGLGSYDPRVAVHCHKLWREGYSKNILFSGKWGNWTKQFIGDSSEAQWFRDVVIQLGYNGLPILIEDESINIGENAEFSYSVCKNSLTSFNSAIVVTKPNTMRRAYATFKKRISNCDIFVDAPYFEYQEFDICGYDEEHLINEMVGDIDRIITYPKLNFQIQQSLPPNVYHAYHILRGRGFTSHTL